MTDVDAADLATRLGRYPPFDSLEDEALLAMATSARVEDVPAGGVVLDAFAQPATEVYVVLDGRVELWNSEGAAGQEPDESLTAGGVFGFSAMLTERSVGPRAVAAGDVTVARIPGTVVTPAFASRRGARFLAERVSSSARSPSLAPTYSLVDELIRLPPLVVDATTSVGDVAREMTEHGSSAAAVRTADGPGLVTDSMLRRRVLVEGLPSTTPVHAVMDPTPAVAVIGDSAAETLILMLEQQAEFVIVTDRSGGLRGLVEPRDFAVSPTAAGVSLHEQLRRAATVEELVARARRTPASLSDLLSRGLAAGRVISVYSAMLDAIIRRAIALVLQDHPDLSADAFTWLSLGSNGRREAVLSSDVDSAASFGDGTPQSEIDRYRRAFADVDDVLTRAGLSRDDHGAAAQRRLFARTHDSWKAAGEQWMAAPAENDGAIMMSLLVDGRPIHGDPGLPAVSRVFSHLREHPSTMRLLLQESLAYRARVRSVRDVLTRRSGTFDIKSHALLPIVNIGRWAALSVGSAALPTTERLQVASGSAMLPEERASTLVEVFEVLQRLRLRYQLQQHQDGEPPSDLVVLERVSPIDRAVISQAVREIAAVQRRMSNVSAYVAPSAWTRPEPT